MTPGRILAIALSRTVSVLLATLWLALDKPLVLQFLLKTYGGSRLILENSRIAEF